jgi:two-component system sensor histidine kinase DegS
MDPIPEEINELHELKRDIHEELDLQRNELSEIDLMLEQSQFEVKKLTQRNSTISTRLQQVQEQFDSVPRADIRMAYDSALESQQRLFVIRGQVEKLHSDREHLERYIKTVNRILDYFEDETSVKKPSNGSIATVEFVELMVQAQEAERQHLSRQMHDGPAQALSNLILQSEIAMRLFDRDQIKAREELNSLKTSAMSTFQKVRNFIFELRPMMLDDLGLLPTIKRYIDIVNEQSNTKFNLGVSGDDRRLEPYIEVMSFRAIQELVTNTLRHSQATEVKIHLDMGETNVKVSVDDNGKGFDVTILDEGENMGIKLIKERAEMLGGHLEIDSLMGQGTRVTFQIPALPVESLA